MLFMYIDNSWVTYSAANINNYVTNTYVMRRFIIHCIQVIT